MLDSPTFYYLLPCVIALPVIGQPPKEQETEAALSQGPLVGTSLPRQVYFHYYSNFQAEGYNFHLQQGIKLKVPQM